MKKDIHPQYKETTIRCACGEVIQTRSTQQDIHVEICSKCHQFFTGKQKLIDSAGRVEAFKKKYEKFHSGEVRKVKKIRQKKESKPTKQVKIKTKASEKVTAKV